MTQCLMITTKDRRRYFTYEHNYSELVEFSKVFNAEISLVAVHDAEIMDLQSLAPAFCNASYRPCRRPKFDVIEVRMATGPKQKKTRREILKAASAIKKHVDNQFRQGYIVCLRKVYQRFKRYNLTLSCVCNHITLVREQLKKEGYDIVRLAAGQYRATK